MGRAVILPATENPYPGKEQSMKRVPPDMSRRAFIDSVAAAGAVAFTACASTSTPRAQTAPSPGTQKDATIKAPDGPVLKAGLIGCGGRGSGAAQNILHAGPKPPIA